MLLLKTPKIKIPSLRNQEPGPEDFQVQTFGASSNTVEPELETETGLGFRGGRRKGNVVLRTIEFEELMSS